MGIVATVRQQPHDIQDYDIDFSEWFPAGDAIVSASVQALPAMSAPPQYAIAPGARAVKVWVLAGGVDGTTYKVTLLASTAAGRQKEVELRVKIKEV